VSLRRWLQTTGLNHVSFHVRDASGQTVAAHDEQVPRRGASTTKLLTVDAALRVLGHEHRFAVEVISDGECMYLRGCHPWLQVQDLLDLSASVVTHHGRLFLDDTRYPAFVRPDGWRPEDLPLNVQPVMALNLREYFGYDPAAAVAEALAGVLTAQGRPTVYAGRAVARGRLSGQLHSPAVLQLAQECLQTSHNLIAEVLARETALGLGLPPAFESMQQALTQGLTADTDGVRLHDGSGLSLDDTVRADLLTHVLHGWLDNLMFVSAALPLGGLTGTLSAVNDWFQSPPGSTLRGYVQAKSGTHVDSLALAGYTYHPQRPLRVFAVLVEGLPGAPADRLIRGHLEEFVHIVAMAPV
jgi:D-alanyl-D-alanine carboxypeptidase